MWTLCEHFGWSHELAVSLFLNFGKRLDGLLCKYSEQLMVWDQKNSIYLKKYSPPVDCKRQTDWSVKFLECKSPKGDGGLRRPRGKAWGGEGGSVVGTGEWMEGRGCGMMQHGGER